MMLAAGGRNLLYDPAHNEPELGQGFSLSASRPSQPIPELILVFTSSKVMVNLFVIFIYRRSWLPVLDAYRETDALRSVYTRRVRPRDL